LPPLCPLIASVAKLGSAMRARRPSISGQGTVTIALRLIKRASRENSPRLHTAVGLTAAHCPRLRADARDVSMAVRD